ncbi:hypothetical protein HY230_07525 [Candidatus Acetothermia bacterium]|nr:hypothetical protein [Candidatus Acetothermia bacterium]
MSRSLCTLLGLVVLLISGGLSGSPASVDLCDGKCLGPTGLGVDSRNNILYILSTGSTEGILQKWALRTDNAGKVSLNLLSSCQRLGSGTEIGPPGPHVLLLPEGVFPLRFLRAFVADQDLILVAASANHRILALNDCPSSGTGIAGNGKPGPTFNSPTVLTAGVFTPLFDVFIHLIFVIDTGNSRVQVYEVYYMNPSGQKDPAFRLFSSSSDWQLPKRLDHPKGIALVPDANLLYIMDTGNGVVDVLQLPRPPVESFFRGDQPKFVFSFPAEGTAIATTRIYLYVVNPFGNSVQVYNRFTGHLVTTITTALDGSPLVSPRGISVDDFGRVYVSDYGNNRVVLLTRN